MWWNWQHDRVRPSSTLKQLWHSPVTSVCYKICLTHRYKNCSLLCSFCKLVHCCTGAWSCVHISISMSHTNGLAVLVPPLTWPDNWVSHPAVSSYVCTQKSVCTKLQWLTTKSGGTEVKLLLYKMTLICCKIWGWDLNFISVLHVWQIVPMLNVFNVQNNLVYLFS